MWWEACVISMFGFSDADCPEPEVSEGVRDQRCARIREIITINFSKVHMVHNCVIYLWRVPDSQKLNHDPAGPAAGRHKPQGCYSRGCCPPAETGMLDKAQGAVPDPRKW